MNSNQYLGRFCRFPAEIDASHTDWMVFAKDANNPMLLILAPASPNRLSADSVCILDADQRALWLYPGVDLSIHAEELVPVLTNTKPFTESPEPAPEFGQTPELETQIQTIENAAFAIKQHFHELEVVPDLTQCELLAGEENSFVWNHDFQRKYQLDIAENSPCLQQTYRGEVDREFGLKIGSQTLTFAEDGWVELTKEQVTQLREQLGGAFDLTSDAAKAAVIVFLKGEAQTAKAWGHFKGSLYAPMATHEEQDEEEANLELARGARPGTTPSDGDTAPAAPINYKFIKGVRLPADLTGGFSITWDIPVEVREGIKSWSVEGWTASQEGTLHRISAKFGVDPSGELDPSTVLFDPSELTNLRREDGKAIYVECKADENHNWHVRIELGVARPPAAER